MQCKSLWIKASAKCINVNVFVAYAEPAAPPLSASSIVASVMSVLGGVALIVLFLICYQRCVKISVSSCCLWVNVQNLYFEYYFLQIYPSESRAGEGRMLSEKKLKCSRGETGLENVQIWPQLVRVQYYSLTTTVWFHNLNHRTETHMNETCENMNGNIFNMSPSVLTLLSVLNLPSAHSIGPPTCDVKPLL